MPDVLRLDAASGGTALGAMDLRLGGVIPFVVARRYASRGGLSETTPPEPGVLGPGWRHGFEMTLDLGETLTVRGGPLDGVAFEPVAPGREARLDASGFVLAHEADAYVLRTSLARQFVFAKTDLPGSGSARLPLVAVRHASGAALRLGYRGDRLDAIETPEGRRVRFGYRGDRLIELALDATRLRTFAYTARGELASVTTATGHATRFEWDGGLIVAVHHPDGARQFAQYDAARRALAVWDADGRVVHARHDPLRQLTRLVAADGAQTLAQHALGRQVLVRLAPDGSEHPVYLDGSERVTGFGRDGETVAFAAHDPAEGTVQSVEARSARLTLDDENQTVAVEDALEAPFRLERDTRGLVEALVTPTGHAWRTQRDRLGRVTALTTPSGRTVRVGWSGTERPVEAGGLRLRDRLDAAGRLAERTDALGRTWSLRRDAEGRPVEIAGPGFGCSFLWDARGRLVGTNDTERHRVRLTRDGLGRVTTVETDGRTLAMRYDDIGRLVEAGPIRLAYDAADRLIEVHRDGETTRYAHDGGTVHLTRDDLRLALDATGALLERASGHDREAFTYGPSGELLLVERTTEAGETLLVFTYDADGLPRSVEHLRDGETRTLRLAHDADGRLESVAFGADALRLERSDDGRLAAFVFGATRLAAETDAAGRLVRLDTPRGPLAVRYDMLDRPEAVTFEERTTDLRTTPSFTLALPFGEHTPRLEVLATRAGLVIGFGVDDVAVPVFWTAERRAERLAAGPAVAIGAVRGLAVVLREPARGGPAALARWTAPDRWTDDATALPTAAALGLDAPALDAFFLDAAFAEAHPERVPGSLPGCDAPPDLARSGHALVTGPHAIAPLRPTPWPERATGPLLAALEGVEKWGGWDVERFGSWNATET